MTIGAMKTRNSILGVLTLLCLLGTGYYAWAQYDAYRKLMEEWNEEAGICFEEALWIEVDKRAEIPFYSYAHAEEGMTTLKAMIPDSVSVMTKEGYRKYKIDRYKYDNSLMKEAQGRAALGALLEISPLSVDTVSANWNKSLELRQLPVRGVIRYVHTDLNLDNDTVLSASDQPYSRFDSLTVKYLGFRCEHELTAFSSCPSGLYALSKRDWCVLLFPWVVLMFLYFYYSKLEAVAKRKLTHEKVIEKTVEVERKIIVEKKIRLADVKMEKAEMFELPDGTMFDVFAGTLEKDGLKQRLQPQSISLLKLFLRADNHQVTSDNICLKLWGNVSHTERLYSAVRRLRNDLKQVKSELFIESSYGVYELKSPISSQDSDQC